MGCRCEQNQAPCGQIDQKPGRVRRVAAAVARAVAPPVRDGFSFYGPLAEATYKACTDPRFWGTTGVPFSLNGPGKRVYVGIGTGIGSARAAVGGNRLTMNPNMVGSQWQDNILAHEVGHICWLTHSDIPADLMSNPVFPNDVTTANDRQRFVRAYRNHGGILTDGFDRDDGGRIRRRRRRRCSRLRRLLGRC